MKPAAGAVTEELVNLEASTVDTVSRLELDPDPKPDKPRRGRPPGSSSATSSSSSAGATSKTGRPSNNDRLAKSLADQYVFIGSLLVMVNPAAGHAMIEQSDACAQSLVSWADANPKVKKALERANNGAGLIGVLAAHAPIALAAISGAPAGAPGGSPPAGAPDLFAAASAGMTFA
jgi:hypothetical protein